MAVLTEITSLIVGGITNIIGGVGSALSDGVGSLFVKTGTDGAITGLNTFGTIVIVFAGVALAFGLCRWLLNFLTSLGQRNR